MLSIMSPLSAPEEQAPSSPLSTPDEPTPCSPEFLVQRSTVSPTVATTEIPKTDRTQVEAKEIRLSDMPPVTLDDSNMHTKTDDITEMNIREDFDNRPSKKAKISESGVLETSPMSPTMSTSNPVSECFESIVPELDNQIDHESLVSVLKEEAIRVFFVPKHEVLCLQMHVNSSFPLQRTGICPGKTNIQLVEHTIVGVHY
ncbi:hypothetical protein VPH35_130207 [Triticum aestivum]|uniref:uncharacterized protein n=1 Tax=Triticum aestivum TaxID=4565 RepID=UPI001D026322|nr:uncharacterized protein LOC123160406 [Triticum aestivum]